MANNQNQGVAKNIMEYEHCDVRTVDPVYSKADVCQIETLHRKTMKSIDLHRTVKFFYLLQLFNDAISK